MKKALKILFTIIFVAGLAFEIYLLATNYSDDALIFAVIGVVFFLSHLLIWVAPKKIFDLCYKISKSSSDNWDYDTSYANIGNVGLGVLIVSVVLLTVSILLSVLD